MEQSIDFVSRQRSDWPCKTFLSTRFSKLTSRRDSDSSRLPVRGIIFLAAPHRGMNVEFLRAIVKNEPPEQLVNELAVRSPTLKELNERFKQVAHDIKILTCYETQKTKTLERDVSPALS